MKRHLLSIALIFIVSFAGCASTRYESWRTWSRTQGGVSNDAELTIRAQSALRRVEAAAGLADLAVRVLRKQQPVAYGFDDGNLFVSSGLLERLNEDELAAAIAHEIGHLLAVDRRAAVSSLDSEAVADDYGRALLRESGIAPEAMLSMLEKVATSRDQELVDRMQARILRLRKPSQGLKTAS